MHGAFYIMRTLLFFSLSFALISQKKSYLETQDVKMTGELEKKCVWTWLLIRLAGILNDRKIKFLTTAQATLYLPYRKPIKTNLMLADNDTRLLKKDEIIHPPIWTQWCLSKNILENLNFLFSSIWVIAKRNLSTPRQHKNEEEKNSFFEAKKNSLKIHTTYTTL